MFKRKKPGIAILEVTMVLAISGFMFAAVIGIYNSRRNSAVDDSARQLVSEISKVRNEAQQGFVPQSVKDSSGGSELYGRYVQINNESGEILAGSVLRQGNNMVLTVDKNIKIGSELKTYLESRENDDCDRNFISCIKAINSEDYNSKLTTGSIYVVYTNRTASQYLFVNSEEAAAFSNYNSSNQQDLRLALALPGEGTDFNAQMQNSNKQYYIYMPILSSPYVEAYK